MTQFVCVSAFRCWVSGVVCIAALAVAVACPAAEEQFPPPGDDTARFESELLASGLKFPAGLALGKQEVGFARPTLFFAESAAGTVRSCDLADPARSQVLISGFTRHTAKGINEMKLGPWSLTLLTPTKLVVVGGVDALAAVYTLTPQSTPLTADQAEAWVGERKSHDSSRLGMNSIVIGETTAYIAPGGLDSSSAIWRANIDANELVDVKEFVKLYERDIPPVGLCLSPEEENRFVLAVSPQEMAGESTLDSLLAYHVPSSGRLVYRLRLGLEDVVGIAFSPAGQLYVIDMALSDAGKGGVYRVDDALWNGKPSCRVVKVASIEHPTSLTFVDSNTLLVASAGKDLGAGDGSLWSIRGNF